MPAGQTSDYPWAHWDVLPTVAEIASQYNISLIIRFDSKPIDPENRADVTTICQAVDGLPLGIILAAS